MTRTHRKIAARRNSAREDRVPRLDAVTRSPRAGSAWSTLARPIVTGLAAVLISTSHAVGAHPLCFEAEDALATVEPMIEVNSTNSPLKGTHLDPKGASGSTFLEVPQGEGNPPKVPGGQSSYTFSLDESGTYYLWCRVWWLDECGNSSTMVLNGGHPFTFGQDAVYKTWHWVKAPRRIKDLKMDAGPQTLIIQNREDGVRIDQILLTLDKRYVPVGVEKSRALPRSSQNDKPDGK
ncbi:MAG: hypothetical protein O2923_00710 [Verrucomicrobia bacterium]|nr:hypothetical protein [Verrucomicrobiota bacterium]MDA1085996.1 hypothetical protein [Verrucomicrobiota bacterium]